MFKYITSAADPPAGLLSEGISTFSFYYDSFINTIAKYPRSEVADAKHSCQPAVIIWSALQS